MYKKKDRDLHLLEPLLPEIPGIIAWATEGLYDLREEGEFVEPTSSVQALLYCQHEFDLAKRFAD